MPENKSKKPKKLKTEKSFHGAQLYMSEKAKKDMRNRPAGGTNLKNRISDAISARMFDGKITPTESGRLDAKTFSDMASRAYNNDDNDTKKFAHGGEVRQGDVRDNAKRGKTY